MKMSKLERDEKISEDRMNILKDFLHGAFKNYS